MHMTNGYGTLAVRLFVTPWQQTLKKSSFSDKIEGINVQESKLS